MTTPPPDDLPFPRRWLAYIAIKLVVLAVLVGVALKYYGLW
jgi:hypothetical protein